jgi:hypothetical protein
MSEVITLLTTATCHALNKIRGEKLSKAHAYKSNKSHLLTISIHTVYIPSSILSHHLLTIIIYKSGG